MSRDLCITGRRESRKDKQGEERREDEGKLGTVPSKQQGREEGGQVKTLVQGEMKEGGEMVEQGQERKARGSHSRTDRTGLGDLARSHGRLRAAHTQPPEGAALRGVSQDEPGERHHRVTAELRHPEEKTEKHTP